jgi:tetratricopeptide (TPR) repeat protein
LFPTFRMPRFRVITSYLRIGACFAVLISLRLALSSPLGSFGQASIDAGAATVKGLVCRADGKGVPGATVLLHSKNGDRTLTTRTDAKGAYIFSKLHPDVYALRAEMAGAGEASSAWFAAGDKQATKIDLTLLPVKAPEVLSAAGGPPELFDEPKFTVAGVTDTANSGGHGSDAIRRTGEALARDTVSLSAEPPSSPVAIAGAPEEKSLRQAAQREPANFTVNYRLGKLLADAGKAKEALPFLEQASRLNPSDCDNGYTLAAAYSRTGQYQRARNQLRALLAQIDKVEIHHLLAEVDERLGDPLDAVREYQHAAQADPSESNLFDWAAELLLHNAIEPAIEVFSQGNRLYPGSSRILMGFGVALFSQGSYEQAAHRLFEASDLNPNDPDPYLFLGRAQSIGKMASREMAEKMKRFASIHGENALANYYYALSLWQLREQTAGAKDMPEVESLLQKAVHIDPKLGAAYLQLGILYSDRGDLPKAITAYESAATANPELEDAHFRLARAYRRNGDKASAQRELQIYDELSKKKTEEVERQRHDMRQFVYQLEEQDAASPPSQ